MAQLRLSISDIEFSDDEAEPIMLDSLSRFTVPNLSKLKLSIMAEEDEEEAKESIFMSSMERKIAQSTRAVSKVNYKFPKMSSPLTRPVNLDELLTGNIDEGFIESEWKALGKIANAPEMDKIAYHPSPKVAKNRNRYGLVLPNSNTRVKLKKSPFPDQNLDYINANFISDSLYSTPRQYIATQAPIEESIADFWCMVAEQHVSMIVMLTQCIETNKEKSVAYWPSEINVEMSVCGGRKIILLGENNITNSSGCIIAKLRRIRLKHAVSLLFVHLNFTVFIILFLI